MIEQEGLLHREKTTVRELTRDALLVEQGWIAQEWLDAQVNAGEHWEADGYPLSMCLHLELWLRAVEAVSKRGEKWSRPFKFRVE